MKSIREYKHHMKTIVYSNWFSYAFLFATLLIWHARLYCSGDDLYFANVWKDESLGVLVFLSMRYQQWSSRVFIEFVLICMTRWIWLWRVLDSLVIAGIAKICARLLGRDQDAAVNWGLCALVLLIPVNVLNEAGWIATSVNYSWPAFCALLALIPVKRELSHESTNGYETVTAMIALVFAANHEQYCVALLAMLSVGTALIIFREKRIPYLCVLELLINLASLVLILGCQGNHVRYDSEVGTWFPQFGEFTIWEKVEMGYSSTGYSLVMQRNSVFVIFALLLAISVWMERSDFLSRMIGTIPVIASLSIGFFHELLSMFFPKIAHLRDALTETGTGLNLSSPGTMIPDLFLGAIFLCVVFGLLTFPNRDKAWTMLGVLVICLGTKVMMGFSPTVWASGDRTGVPLMIGLIWMSGMLIQEIERKDEGRAGQLITRTGGILVFLCMLERLI